jgi:hypothetical protein
MLCWQETCYFRSEALLSPETAVSRRQGGEAHDIMARIVAEAGRCVSPQATILRHSMRDNSLTIVRAYLAAMLAFAKWCFRRIDKLEFELERWRKGVTGEVGVGLVLDQLPKDFRVIRDVATPAGNIDHVVVGPTGVFLLDTKDWRGTVAGDGNGELTLNGRTLYQRHVGRFVARIMHVKEKVRALAPGPDIYFEAVFVFTSARVDAGIGTTGAVHCIRDPQLFDYIVNKRFGKRLPAPEVERIAQAFLDLAQMEIGFSEKAEAVCPACRVNEPGQFTRHGTRTRTLVAAGA